jgi:hypothetical protein
MSKWQQERNVEGEIKGKENRGKEGKAGGRK